MNSTTDAGDVLLFYGHGHTWQYREFSNFYWHKAPFKYVLPNYAHKEGLPKEVWCEFSEKAIMATKAALMGDAEIFREINGTSDPATCKQFGREVKNFDESLWQKHLPDIAFEVCRQKFESQDTLRQLLLSTGDRIIAEAAPTDSIWGIGLSTTDIEAQDPSKWKGSNILGEALMQARTALRGGGEGEILLFYGHGHTWPYREFSNFYWHKAPFKFELPQYAHKEGLPKEVWCKFSEKAIMATKAALMGDAEIFREIDSTTDPAVCKECGRKVKNFDEILWQKHLEDIAFQVCKQKFESQDSLRQLLLSTGDRIIAEAAPTDSIWGIGLSTTDIEAQDPCKWQGTNILGEALMKARTALRGGDTAADSEAPEACA